MRLALHRHEAGINGAQPVVHMLIVGLRPLHLCIGLLTMLATKTGFDSGDKSALVERDEWPRNSSVVADMRNLNSIESVRIQI